MMISVKKTVQYYKGTSRREIVGGWRIGREEKLGRISRRRLHLSYILKERVNFMQAKEKKGLFRKLIF